MATTRHPKAAFFVQRQLFAGLTSFAELESKIAALPDEQARGAAFEVFAEAYLATQRKHDAAQVWPHGSVPLDLLKNLGLTQQDQGVDGVLQTSLGQFNPDSEMGSARVPRVSSGVTPELTTAIVSKLSDGEQLAERGFRRDAENHTPEAYAPIIGFAAYQVKFRTGRPALTWRELSTFIGLADSPHIHSRVLLTNCDELPAVLNDRQGFFCIRGSDLDRLEAADFRAMEAWLAEASAGFSGLPAAFASVGGFGKKWRRKSGGCAMNSLTRACSRPEYSGTFDASCSVSMTTCGMTLASTPSTIANAKTNTKMMARARGIFLRSKKSTTGARRHARTAAIASGHSTGLNKFSTRPSPHTAATINAMTVATASPVSANQMTRDCFSVGGGKGFIWRDGS